MICYAINRENTRHAIFHKLDDYDAFLRVLAEGFRKVQVDLFLFVLMPDVLFCFSYFFVLAV